MTAWLFWFLFGALVGYLAAQRNGWNRGAGAVGGALLGLLSPLLFFAKGVGAGDTEGRGVRLWWLALIAAGFVVLVILWGRSMV